MFWKNAFSLAIGKCLCHLGNIVFEPNVCIIGKVWPLISKTENFLPYFVNLTAFVTKIFFQGSVVRNLVSANRWLRGIKTYRFLAQPYPTLSANLIGQSSMFYTDTCFPTVY